MKWTFVLLGLSLWWNSAACGGTIRGTVKAQGREEVQETDGGKYDSRKFKFAPKINYAALRDFVVYIDEPPATKPAPPKPVQVVTQKDATFKPHVLPVLVNTVVEWPNEDEIFHNVFSISDRNEFDLDLYKRPAVKKVTFKHPGRVDVFCSIHKDMHCIVLVLENPHFAVTDARNQYVITNVPPGTYRLKAWHERVPSSVKEVTVPAEGEVRVDFVLGFSGQNKD
ncbi:MAG: carboxypeptidase regulatory-like domain-containing protein [Verrucomicrobiota bacterium]|jgi:plastocyanin